MDHTGAIVVGLGSADGGRRELDWAAREAALRNRPLHVLRAYHLSEATVPWETATDRMLSAELHAAARQRVDAALAYVAETTPTVDACGFAIDGQPNTVLRDATGSAELTVVGSRQLRRLGAMVLGSVSAVVAGAATGPVVVVRAAPGDPAEAPKVVAGVDGSDITEAVLDFAFDYASRHDRELRVVYCWRPDVLAEMEWRITPAAPERAERWVAEAVAGYRAKYPDVRLHPVVVRQHAVDGLVAESLSQELLVVGAHAHHPRLTGLLGSVSQGVLHHATCPVAVIHAP